MTEEIKSWLEGTGLSENSKEKLLEESLKIYEKINNLLYLKEEKLKASLFLACDKYSCAVTRKIPKPKEKILSEARKKTGIKNVEAIGRINSMCNLLGRGEDISEKAKEILNRYKERYSADYYRGSPSSTAVCTIYIASILCGKHITQEELSDSFGMTDGTIRNRYKIMKENLDIDILL